MLTGSISESCTYQKFPLVLGDGLTSDFMIYDVAVDSYENVAFGGSTTNMADTATNIALAGFFDSTL